MSNPNLRNGSLETITGPMAAGKSEEMIRRIRRALIARRKVQIFKPALDDRYSGINYISTHNGTTVEARPIRGAAAILEHLESDTQVLAVDEVQFFGDEVVAVLNEIARRGVRVIAVGTDVDFRGNVFGPMGALMATSDQVDKLTAICVLCGGPATRNQRLLEGRPAPYDGPVVQVGGLESYESRCRHCHELPRSLDESSGLVLSTPEGEVDAVL